MAGLAYFFGYKLPIFGQKNPVITAALGNIRSFRVVSYYVFCALEDPSGRQYFRSKLKKKSKHQLLMQDFVI